MQRILKPALAAITFISVFAMLFASSASSPPPTEAGNSSRLQVATISPLVAERVLELVADASPLVQSVYDGDGLTGVDACILVYAIRIATGNEDDAARLDPDKNTVPCEGDAVPAGEITPEDFELLGALDAEQVSENGEAYTDGLLVIILNEDPLDETMEIEASDGSIWTAEGGTFTNHGEHFTCDAVAEDPDCTTTGFAFRDSTVAFGFSGPFNGRGDVTITASIDGDDEVIHTIQGVGDPDTVAPLLNLNPKLEVGGTQVCKPNGEDFTFANLLQITTLANLPDAGLVAVQALDSDGTSLTGIPVEWQSADEDIVIPGFDSQFSLFNSGLLLGPNLICSATETGTTTVRARVSRGQGGNRTVPQESTTLEFTVVGRPAQLVAYADPPTIDCNGINTTTVTLILLDASANSVAGGHEIRFDLQVLGTANPITATTNGEGTATSVVTPLAQEGVTGVPVNISTPIGPTTVLVNCQVGAGAGVPGSGTIPPPTTPGSGTGSGGQTPGTGVIVGPDTGSGGLAGRGALPVWPAVALFVAAMGLVGARFGLRRMS